MRVTIFANGVLDDPAGIAAVWVDAETVIVAADGGTNHILAAGLVPHHVIGDVDSLSEDVRGNLGTKGTEFHIAPPAKDETDLELALLWAADQPDVETVIILGALGGRPDQAMANLLLLALPALQGRRVFVVDGPWTIRLIRSGASVTLSGEPGDRLSLIPLGGDAEGVTTKGLAYPLKDETLYVGRARGVSNRLDVAEPTVTVRSGLLWAFHERQALRKL